MFENLENGFKFLTISLGVFIIFMTIVVGVAADDNSRNTKIYAAIDILAVILFLASGFMWQSL